MTPAEPTPAIDILDVIDGIVGDTHPEGDGCPLCRALDDLRDVLEAKPAQQREGDQTTKPWLGVQLVQETPSPDEAAIYTPTGCPHRCEDGHAPDARYREALAERDRLREAIRRDLDGCRACADPSMWVAWSADRGWCAVHQASGSALAATATPSGGIDFTGSAEAAAAARDEDLR